MGRFRFNVTYACDAGLNRRPQSFELVGVIGTLLLRHNSSFTLKTGFLFFGWYFGYFG